MTAAGSLAIAVLGGGLIGSFLNVVIARVPAGESVLTPGSHCRNCERALLWHENLPVISWLLLRARCRGCGGRISVRYPLIEVGTAFLFALTVQRLGVHSELAAHLIAFAALLALAIIDIDCLRVPVVVLYPALALTAVALAVPAVVDDRGDDFARALAGAGIGFALLRLIHWVSPRAMGYGDVRLAGLCGLVLGWHGFSFLALGLYGSFVLGAVVGLSLIAAKRAKLGRSMPFAPFLGVAAIVTVLFGDGVAAALRRLLGAE